MKVGGVTINPPTDARFLDLQNFADAGTTDEEGRVTLRLGGQPIQFVIQDQVSGQPIPGLVAGISTGTGTVGLGVLEVFDRMGQYPPRFVILHGAGGELAPPAAPQSPQLPVGEGEANLSIVLSAEGEAGEAPIEVTLLEKALDAGSLIEALELTKYLPALKAPTSVLTTAGGLLEAFGYLAKAADQVTAGAVSRAVGSTDPTSPKSIRNAEALAKIRQSANDGSMKSLFMAGLAGFGAGGPVGALTGVGLGLLATQLYRYLDEQTVINCPDGYLVESKLGNVQLYTCGATPAVTWTWPVTVETTLENGQPVSGGSLHLIGKDRLGEGVITEVGTDGTAAAEVPEGDLQVNYFRPGRVPSATAKTVPTGGGTLAMQASNPTTVATVTIQATPGITGLLSPGTQIQFSAVAQDQAGEVVPCSPTYEIFNPVGANVATINQTTGLMTVNADPGAARVVAYCGAISSKPRLVSGMGAAAANLPVITISDTEVVEGNSGTTNCAFDLVVSKAGSQRIYVDYNSAYLGSAQPGLDYTDVTGKKELILGQINRVNVPVRGDYLFEGDEQFALGLSNPVGARLDLKNRRTLHDSGRRLAGDHRHAHRRTDHGRRRKDGFLHCLLGE